MKKILIYTITASLVLTSALFGYAYDKSEKISSSVIRLHIVANSDSPEDQAVKLKVRDAVTEAMKDKIKTAKNIDDARKIIEENMSYITNIANDVLAKNGYDYTSGAELTVCEFPAKSYANITLPRGKYEAVRITLGRAEGQNWWCVMFPPLCFNENSVGELDEESKEQLKNAMGKSTYEIIDNENDKLNIKYKFKLVEIYEEIKSWL